MYFYRHKVGLLTTSIRKNRAWRRWDRRLQWTLYRIQCRQRARDPDSAFSRWTFARVRPLLPYDSDCLMPRRTHDLPHVIRSQCIECVFSAFEIPVQKCRTNEFQIVINGSSEHCRSKADCALLRSVFFGDVGQIRKNTWQRGDGI